MVSSFYFVLFHSYIHIPQCLGHDRCSKIIILSARHCYQGFHVLMCNGPKEKKSDNYYCFSFCINKSTENVKDYLNGPMSYS